MLQRPDGTYRVYVNVNGKALSRDVTVGTWKETDWIVLTGLKAGDEVILDNLQRIKEGSPVKATVTPVSYTHLLGGPKLRVPPGFTVGLLKFRAALPDGGFG